MSSTRNLELYLPLWTEEWAKPERVARQMSSYILSNASWLLTHLVWLKTSFSFVSHICRFITIQSSFLKKAIEKGKFHTSHRSINVQERNMHTYIILTNASFLLIHGNANIEHELIFNLWTTNLIYGNINVNRLFSALYLLSIWTIYEQ